MNELKAMLAGLCGSLTLNILHKKIRAIAPINADSNILGEAKSVDSFERINENLAVIKEDYYVNFLTNIISNTLLFSTIGFGKQRNFFGRAIMLGLASGLSAIKISDETNQIDQQATYIKRTSRTTIALYLTGSLITATLLTLLKRGK